MQCSLALFIAYCVAHVAAYGADVRSTVCHDSAVAYHYSDLNTTAPDFDFNYCASTIAPGVVALCIDQHYPNKVAEYWRAFGISDYCTVQTLPDYAVTLANATLYLGEVPTSEEASVTPFLIPKESFENHYRTEYAYADMISLSETYGWIVIVLGCAVMLVAGLSRMLKSIGRSKHMAFPGAQSMIRKYITVPALLSKNHAHRPRFMGIEMSIPTRLESLFLLGFIVLNTVFVFVSFDIFEGNYYWPENIDQFNRYVADRSGILSIAQFPFLFAFAGRNTIFIWLTGWSFETFSVFHKWIARVSVVHAFVHTIAYTVIFYREGGLSYMALSYKDVYLQWGAAAMVAGFILVTSAVYGIRKRWYEIFLVSHILFAVVWLVGVFYHVKLLDEPKYMPWMWTAIAIWAFDRTVRLLRLAVINYTSLGSREQTLSKISLLGEDVMQLEIPVTSRWSSTPGQYVFLYFPKFGFWQSHPFTILRVSKACESISKTNEKLTTTIESHEVGSQLGNSDKLSFVFRAHKGVTRKLLEAAVSNGGELKTRALIEGPYGATHDLRGFDQIILLAGGMGITACLPFLEQIMHQSHSRLQDVVLHWIVRERSSLSWCMQDIQGIMNMQTDQKQVRIILHITNGTDQKVPTKFSSDSESRSSIKGVTMTGGRPALSELVHEAVTDSLENASIAVLSCGPGRFSDDCRKAVVNELGESRRSIQYFEESFTW